MPGAQVQDTGRALRRAWLRITLAALLVSLAGLAAVTLKFASGAERALGDVREQAALSVRFGKLDGVLPALADAESAGHAYRVTGNGRDGRTIAGARTQMGDVVAIAPPSGARPPREVASQSTHRASRGVGKSGQPSRTRPAGRPHASRSRHDVR